MAHPVLGPDNLVFLVALSLVGLSQRSAWMLALLVNGLAGNLPGLMRRGLTSAETLAPAVLILEALVHLAKWQVESLLPALGMLSYALSISVLGCTGAPWCNT